MRESIVEVEVFNIAGVLLARTSIKIKPLRKDNAFRVFYLDRATVRSIGSTYKLGGSWLVSTLRSYAIALKSGRLNVVVGPCSLTVESRS